MLLELYMVAAKPEIVSAILIHVTDNAFQIFLVITVHSSDFVHGD